MHPSGMTDRLRDGGGLFSQPSRSRIINSKSMEDFKPISQNLMHKSITITDGIYGNLVNDDVSDTIAHLEQQSQTSEAGSKD
jgi:hypothetical protein